MPAALIADVEGIQQMIWNESFDGTRTELLEKVCAGLKGARIAQHDELGSYCVSNVPDVPGLRWRLTITIDGHAQSTATQGSNYVAVFYKLLS